MSWGNEFRLFDFCGIRASILTCYDNNLVENPRIVTLRGAEVIFAPHVTGGLESPMPGRGKIDKRLWDNRDRDPVSLRMEFDGPKGRGWLMHWLPARAYENGVYYVFSNAVGVDHDTIKPGGAMIIDPFGEIVVESHALGDDVVVGLCTPEKIERSGGRRYLRARRPELYGKLVGAASAGTEAGGEPGLAAEGRRGEGRRVRGECLAAALARSPRETSKVLKTWEVFGVWPASWQFHRTCVIIALRYGGIPRSPVQDSAIPPEYAL